MSAGAGSSAAAKPITGATKPGVAARAVATELFVDILDHGQPLDHLIDPHEGAAAHRALPPRDRRLVHAIVATALRRKGEIDAALDRLIERKLPRRSGGLRRVLEIAATQILFMDVADHAAVSVALEQIAADRNARHFKGLANAVLRRLGREKDAILADIDGVRLNTPDWLWQRWSQAYGEAQTRRIAEMHQIEPGLDLTVKADPAMWAERLDGIALATGTVRLVSSGPVENLSGYGEGEWWVQDAAAALPARLLEPLDGMRVADLCAAPGGKTAALAHAGATVTAVDISAERLERLRTNLSRLGLAAETVAADVRDWTPSARFDRVLLDAPCTATGTIRRHPDIARLKRQSDIASLSAVQEKLLARAVDILKPGGILVYCTCSLEPEEGEVQFERALARHELKPLPITSAEIGGIGDAVTESGMVRTLPSQLPAADLRLAGLDGFFIGRCQKS